MSFRPKRTVATTYRYGRVPFRDGRGIAENILAGFCDVCGEAIVIPAQSTPAIAQARKRVDHALEVNIYANGLEKTAELAEFSCKAAIQFVITSGMPNRRLSMKLNDAANNRVEQVLSATRLSKTDLIKSLVMKINKDIVQPAQPMHLDELISIAEVLYA